MIPDSIKKNTVPHAPGVYLFKNSSGKILYVGKAVDLYHRVASYFSAFHPKGGGTKTFILVKNIASVETITVSSEIEALILEANLIKKYLPPYNIKLTDDKDYLYIKITKEIFPKIITARKNDLNDAKIYFGPFPSARVVGETLKKLRHVFPWCSNPAGKGPCFYFHLHLCPGPCAGKISLKDYDKIIRRFIKFMEGKSHELQKELGKEMKKYSDKKEFEKAQEIKKMVENLSYLTQATSIKGYLENPNFLENQNMLALQDLKDKLKLFAYPERIECFDISNILGQHATGSLVVLTNGVIDKKWYRKFKIRRFGKPDDTGMIAEVIARRLKHKEWPFPDLILVDGGKGQASAANSIIGNLGLKIPVFGLAKRMEWVYGTDGRVVKLPRSALSLRTLQTIRDEAHRFAKSYYSKLHRSMLYNN